MTNYISIFIGIPNHCINPNRLKQDARYMCTYVGSGSWYNGERTILRGNEISSRISHLDKIFVGAVLEESKLGDLEIGDKDDVRILIPERPEALLPLNHPNEDYFVIKRRLSYNFEGDHSVYDVMSGAEICEREGSHLNYWFKEIYIKTEAMSEVMDLFEEEFLLENIKVKLGDVVEVTMPKPTTPDVKGDDNLEDVPGKGGTKFYLKMDIES